MSIHYILQSDNDMALEECAHAKLVHLRCLWQGAEDALLIEDAQTDGAWGTGQCLPMWQVWQGAEEQGRLGGKWSWFQGDTRWN